MERDVEALTKVLTFLVEKVADHLEDGPLLRRRFPADLLRRYRDDQNAYGFGASLELVDEGVAIHGILLRHAPSYEYNTDSRLDRSTHFGISVDGITQSLHRWQRVVRPCFDNRFVRSQIQAASKTSGYNHQR